MTAYVEGFPVLAPGNPLLHTWVIPGTNRRLTLRNGSCGFVQAHNALRFHDKVERLDQPAERHGAIDDGGHNYRPITGGNGWSKHATGLAADLNWSRHPYNTKAGWSFTPAQIRQIHRNLLLYRDEPTGLLAIEWGGDWPSHPGSKAKPDPMHFQISSAVRMAHVERVARRLINSPRGRRILAANPGQLEVILS
jgi:hypothetical protein